MKIIDEFSFFIRKREQSFYELNEIKKNNSFDEKIDKFYTILDHQVIYPFRYFF